MSVLTPTRAESHRTSCCSIAATQRLRLSECPIATSGRQPVRGSETNRMSCPTYPGPTGRPDPAFGTIAPATDVLEDRPARLTMAVLASGRESGFVGTTAVETDR